MCVAFAFITNIIILNTSFTYELIVPHLKTQSQEKRMKMSSEIKIFAAFILNFVFSIFEFFGGIFTGSVAIISDAVHDMGDAVSIALSWLLEKKSKKEPDEKYTFGYGRYSVLGGIITSVILLLGSIFVIINGVKRILTPTYIYYDGMIIFAVIGLAVNLAATFFTHGKGSLNLRSVSLHMLEDVLGWTVVLIGAVVMKFTNFILIDPIMSIIVAAFILIGALKNLRECSEVFLMKAPRLANPGVIQKNILEIEGVLDVHHIHVWSMDGENHCASVHIVCTENTDEIKKQARHTLKKAGIYHVTVETENPESLCENKICAPHKKEKTCHHHH